MKYIIAVLTLAVAASPLALSRAETPAQTQPAGQQSAAPAQPDPLEQTFVRLEQEWMGAVQKRDAAALNRLVASEFTFTTSVMPGQRANRAQFLQASLNPAGSLDHFALDQLTVRVVGEVAVVTSLVTLKGQQESVDVSGDYYATDVWVRRNNAWQVAARHLMLARRRGGGGRQGGNAQRAGNGRRRMGPCEKQCRSAYAAATTNCRMQVDTDEFIYEQSCMDNARAALNPCLAACGVNDVAKGKGRGRGRAARKEGAPN